MTGDAEYVLATIPKRYGLDRSRIARPEVFERAVNTTLVLMPAPAVVDEVVALGALTGARDEWGVVLARLRLLPVLAGKRAAFAEQQAEAARWCQVDRALRRGETNKALVARGDLSKFEAVEQLEAEFSDDPDLLALATAALTGGQRE